MKVYTVGFTQKSAEQFFDLLRRANVKRVVDVRLNNTGQLAGFSKKDDLVFFLRELGGIDYIHVPELAPTKDILDAYKKHKGSWEVYEQEFLSLMEKRHIDQTVAREVIDGGCLLCSEHKPHHCHRRLVVDYLQNKWGQLDRTDLI
jgi:uncharacterized protein (DUF488 family)